MRAKLASRLAFAVGLGIGASASHSVAAQETIGSYYAALGPQDYRNSSGVALTSFAAVLQQDRANYHRFGLHDAGDEGDPYFGQREMRLAIPALFAAADNGWWDQHFGPATSAPRDADILVVICGSGGRPTHLIVNHANGDGYTLCEGQISAGN